MPQSNTMLCLVALILSLMAGGSVAQTAAKSRACCGLMAGKIYCYGGFLFTKAKESTINDSLDALDITNKSGVLSDDLKTLWQNVPYTKEDNVDLTPRAVPQCVVISDQNRIIINGGSTDTSALNNTNIMYDALQNKWYAQSDYAEAPYGKRQIFDASGSYVPGRGAAFYGGYEKFSNPNWVTPNTNVSNFTSADGLTRYIGYTQVSFFNMDNPTPVWNTPVPLTTASDRFYGRHQSVFDPTTNMLLFMGGVYRTTTSRDAIPNDYSSIRTFNTLTNQWGTMDITGDKPTLNRVFSTLTLLPSTGRHVLLYGGEANDAVVTDYCNVLNLDTKVWTRQNIVAPAGTNLQRSRHSSVLVNNNTLFIMWGIYPSKEGTSSVIVLNVTNPDAITLSEKYIDPNAPNAPNTTEESNGKTLTPGNSNSGGLSSGIKAGIAVAAVVVVILGALVVWLCFRNRKNERIRKQEQELAKQQQQADYYHPTNDVEPMEVDWDKIETNYTEVPAASLANNNNELLVAGHDNSTASTTIVNGGSLNANDFAAVHPDAYAVQHPNSMDPLSQTPRVSKPDGGYK